jgi:hypothetical protein
MSYQDNEDQYDAKYECQTSNLKKNFTNLIRGMQLEINEIGDIMFEWIPYDQFNDIKEIGEEGFDKIYSAIWKDGPLYYDKYKNKYTRNQQNVKVALKLCNLQNIFNEFFNDQVTIKFLNKLTFIYYYNNIFILSIRAKDTQ